ncbi:molybdopterin-synthase adenylyltransferase MoeB [Timonella sp. A28]|uniref:molybdopterin-synthase adenylyltransferase MoeB n=1 Tax=Timonella sp. A28 TaxID=3442640 RepID=UPI003EB8B131
MPQKTSGRGPVQSVPRLRSEQFARYARHLALPQVGIAGQERLLSAHVLVVGTGGLGAPALTYLTAAGVGTITVIDDDTVSLSNLQRQVLFTADDLGKLKVEVTRRALAALNPDVTIQAIAQRLTAENVNKLVANVDLVIDGTDNFDTRYLLNDACVTAGVPYIWAAIYQFDAQMSVFGYNNGPCYRCIFPSQPQPGTVPTCASGGVIGVLPGMVGTLQAMEAIKLLLEVGTPLSGKIAVLDALTTGWQYLPLAKNPSCPTCSIPLADESVALTMPLTSAGCGTGIRTADAHGTTNHSETNAELSRIVANLPEDTLLLDVRTQAEHSEYAIPESLNIPLDELLAEPSKVPPASATLVYCASGQRSAIAAAALTASHRKQVSHLTGGLAALTERPQK